MVTNIHGGNTYRFPNKDKLLDFSSNINPLGIPLVLKDELLSSIDTISCYPDAEYRDLIGNIGSYYNIKNNCITVSNGAVELIYNSIKALNSKRVLIPSPAFAEYKQAALDSGAEVFIHILKSDKNFIPDINSIITDAAENRCDTIIICNPNNPTSVLMPKEKIRQLASLCYENKINVIIDETFIELTKQGNSNSVMEFIEKYDNILIIRAFTKILAIPGLRLGYSFSNPEKALALKRMQLQWSVNSLASCVGNVLSKLDNYFQNTIKWVSKEPAELYKQLSKLNYIKPYRPDTNFILIKLASELYAEKIYKHLLNNNILIRKAGNFDNLDDSYIRVAVRNKNDNDKLIELLENI